MKEVHRDKLIKVLGMLGSAHDGEVLQAAQQAHRMLAESGNSWQDVIVHSQSNFDTVTVIKTVDKRLASLPSHDQKIFLEMREKYFANELSNVDLNRLRYFFERYVPTDDDGIPF